MESYIFILFISLWEEVVIISGPSANTRLSSVFSQWKYFCRNPKLQHLSQNRFGRQHLLFANWEKSSSFNALVRVFAQIYANTWQRGHNVPPPLGQIGLKSILPFSKDIIGKSQVFPMGSYVYLHRYLLMKCKGKPSKEKNGKI